MRLLFSATLAACFLAGCGSSKSAGESSDAGRADADAAAVCDPLATPPVTFGHVLGVGKDPGGVVYAADQAMDAGQELAGCGEGCTGRVFVSDGGTLVRQHVAGSGGSGSGSGSYEFLFEPPLVEPTPAQPFPDARQLFVFDDDRGATAMDISSSGAKMLEPDAGDVALALLDAAVLSGFRVVNLPRRVYYVADVHDGNVVVVVVSEDDGYSLYFGPPSALVQRAVTSVDDTDTSFGFVFSVGGVTYESTTTNGGADYLEEGTAKVSMTLRTPTPTTLAGLMFTCSGT